MVCIHSHYPPRGLFQSLSFPLFLLSKLTSFLKWKSLNHCFWYDWNIMYGFCRNWYLVRKNFIGYQSPHYKCFSKVKNNFKNFKILGKKQPIRLHCPTSIVFWVGNMLPEIKMISTSLNFCILIHTLVHIVFILDYPSQTPWNSSFLSLQQPPMVKITLEVQTCDQVTFHYRWKKLVLDGFVAIYVG